MFPPGHSHFCEVDRAYIEDAFNLFGLKEYVPEYTTALDLILDKIGKWGIFCPILHPYILERY